MNGTTALRRASGAGGQEPPPVVTLVVYKDDAGYGMKVSGDNPVYVQSVKEGGAAARAGLHSGDKIIKVNGVNVMQSTHTDVVDLIKSSTQVVLTVQQKPMGSPGLPGTPNQHQRPASLSAGSTMVSPQPATSLHRASTAPAGSSPCTARITGPQPVDKPALFPAFVSSSPHKNYEQKRQLETQRVHTFQLMLEKEQSYVDNLRSEMAKAGTGCANASLQTKLAGAERRVCTLKEQLAACSANDQLCSLVTNSSTLLGPYSSSGSSSSGGGSSIDTPPPLPSRKSLSMQSLSPPPLPPRPPPAPNAHNVVQSDLERQLLTHLTPPTTSHGIPNSLSQGANLGSPSSLNKHQRTKSSPEQLGTTAPTISPLDASRLLIASESMIDLSPPRHGRFSGVDLDDPVHITPPGTPPPPYPQPSPGIDISSSTLNDSLMESYVLTTPRQIFNDSSPGLPPIQQPIMSMEDDDMSDQEVGQLEDHGPFKSLSRLWEHNAHLAVFINFVLSNSDPSSLLFYLVTDLYKEGNAKEMRKWSYEIHSSFLVPGAPLRLNNVDESVAREIDDVLLRESDKEEILRKIFWKARTRAKEELNEQLADFQKKRTAGLGMLFGPSDAQLDESESDKSKEAKIIETYLLPKMDPYLEDVEKDQLDIKQFTTAAGLATILTKIFQVRSVSLDRVPTFVAKDKSNIKARLLTGKTRKMTVRGHHFGANQYYTVTYCNHCQLIIGGIGPQGYQCSDCFLNVHRQCGRTVEENCPGPLNRKERGNDRISKFMERIRSEKKSPSLHHHHGLNQPHFADRVKRSEEDAALTDGENVEDKEKNHCDASFTAMRMPSATANSSEEDPPYHVRTKNSSPLMSSLDSIRRSTEKYQRKFNRKFKNDGIKKKTKKVRSHTFPKSTIAEKVWETLSSVRRPRSAYTGSIFNLNDIASDIPCILVSNLPISRSGSENGDEDESECKNLEGLDNTEGGGASGNTRSSAERGRISAYGDHLDSMDDPSSREDISEMVQQNISSKPKTSNINRSESYKERIHHKRQLREKRKTSDPNLSKTNDSEAAGAFPGNSAGSSSNSSLSTRSLDSPSTSLEQVHPATAGHNTSTSWGSDEDVEPDPPDWSQSVPEDVLAQLSNSEKKRQEVINELFHTERSHVRALKVLSYMFHKPIVESQVLPLDQIQLLFSNLDEMVTIHSRFNQAMKRKKKENPCVGEVGDLILEMFDGENGTAFERAASIYCAKQQVALDALRDRRRKDPKVNAFLNEVEANPMCRRLQLKDHILTGMLRLTKYPLLFENLAKYTPDSMEKEKVAVLRAVERSKEILSLVNQAVREAEDGQRLSEILRMIDRSAFDKFDHPAVQEFKNLDITKRNLIFEGPLQCRIVNRPKPVDLHVVLLDDTILLLHRQDEKYLLKFMNTNQVNSVLSPIVKISTVLVRHNAVDKNSLYLVNTAPKGAQIYDLVASSEPERKLWCRHISEAAETYYKARDRGGRRPSPTTVMAEEPIPAPEVPLNIENNASHVSQQVDKEKVEKDSSVEVQEPDQPEVPPQQQPQQQQSEPPADTTSAPAENVNVNVESDSAQQPQPPNASRINDSMILVTSTECSLIDPLEVHAEIRPVHEAEPVLTPIECLRRKDEVIKQALADKQSLVADILNIPKEDFDHVADIASELSELEKEPAELILAAISQANQLVGMLNSALVVTETDAVLASRGTATNAAIGCETVGCPSPRSHSHPQQPVVPVVALQPICHSLTMQLSQLLKIVKEREEERERLRKQLQHSRERLHAIDLSAQRRDMLHFSMKAPQAVVAEPGDYDCIDGIDNINKDEFVDACGDPRADITVDDETLETKKTEVMGDSGG